MPHVMMTVCWTGLLGFNLLESSTHPEWMLEYTHCAPCDDDSMFDRALGVIFARVKYSP